jgi:RNA polymerase sigma factor (sigma-70 family)
VHTAEMIPQPILAAPTTTMTDGLLAQLTIAGDQRAFEILVQRYSTPLFNFIYRFLNDYDQAHDILQQVFLRFYTALPKLDTGESFKPWLFQVARNCCVDELRRRKRHAIQFSQLETEDGENEFSFLNEIPDSGPSLDELMDHRDLQQMLREAIQSLPPKFRSVVVLRYASQLSFSEIGKVLSMPEATAKTYFHRAKLLLRKILSSQLTAGMA